MTGWYRDGKCRTDAWDRGSHTVCAVMTEDFLQYTKSMGNDLSTPRFVQEDVSGWRLFWCHP